MMSERSIEWLKKQDINKRFRVCKNSDRKLVKDPDFENWIQSDSIKRVAFEFGESFQSDEKGFCFFAQAFPRPKIQGDHFPFLEPIYSLYRCPWSHVTAVYKSEGSNGDDYVYIFTCKTKRRKSSRK